MTKARCVVAVLALGILLAGVSQAEAGKGKKKGERVNGTVVSVEKTSEKSTLTIKTHAHKKKNGTVTEAKEVTLKFDSATKFEMGSKKDFKAADASALSKGEHVSVVAKDGHADSVRILQGKKAKKKQ